MTVFLHALPKRRLGAKALAPWADIRSPIATDSMNKANALDAAIRPIKAGYEMLGQALTVRAMAGDITPLLHALSVAQAGDVMVVDGAAYTQNAILGGNMTNEAVRRGMAGLVIDGAIRDVAEIRDLDIPCFTRAVTPAGPNSSFIGDVGGPISCGGVQIKTGDLVIGDDDGITIVPKARMAEVLAACQATLQAEGEWERRIAAGEPFSDILELPPMEPAP
ncbi:MAG: RraA family protein [Rhodospirillaceae bacterium]|jgi:4-hydroxy-4-methyl-2-oxoglutarate aldolase|nr:RraA family protein [Rhodospirillaceae bacterium]MBT5898041.1 RraA family protein [Rhodospirillaceae bacterium]MBT6430607.1 RraA family protein [Rhodospirillaceae bacterium]MBT7756538.1 RraA family protein [Rhodospirillaceae bacterium]